VQFRRACATEDAVRAGWFADNVTEMLRPYWTAVPALDLARNSADAKAQACIRLQCGGRRIVQPEWRRRTRTLAGYAGGVLLGVAAWQIVGSHSQPQIFVTLTATLRHLGSMIDDGTLPQALANSFSVYGAGVGIAILLGALGGLLLARIRVLRVAFEPYIMGLYATPLIALIPFILALLGYRFWPKVVVVFLFCVFPVLLATQRGAQSVAVELMEVAKLYRSSERAIWLHVIIPYTLPFFMTGVRQALARGLVGMIAADIFLSANGLGGLLISAAQQFSTAEMLAVVLVITVAGLTLMAVGRLVEKYFARWRVTG
jgi:ABC-type nitrate/sulfonate/bicarbonate transport system permease component